MEPLIDLRRDARRIVTVLLVLLLANAIFYLLLVLPKVRENSALVAERASFQNDLAAARKRTEKLRAAYERIVAQEKGLDRFYNEILGTKLKKLVEIQKEITGICHDFGIEPQEMRNDTSPVPAGRVERFTSTLPLKGDYQNLRRFIARVENSENFLVIDRVTLSGTKEGGAQLQLNVDVATYFDAPWLATPQKGRRIGRPGRGNA
ncbi:MAG: hypothetical protein DMF49_13430 [Acidobacteria bacterium]|nr:MAG: hypothetical protein DMF49_13430 [Acidobacteriota bacterium]